MPQVQARSSFQCIRSDSVGLWDTGSIPVFVWCFHFLAFSVHSLCIQTCSSLSLGRWTEFLSDQLINFHINCHKKKANPRRVGWGWGIRATIFDTWFDWNTTQNCTLWFHSLLSLFYHVADVREKCVQACPRTQASLLFHVHVRVSLLTIIHLTH